MTPHPYPGLRPFKREESDIFFGREQHVDQLLEKLGQHHFLAVVGTSGCGKSSLVKAGMLPALDAGFLAQAGAHWYVADLRPGHRPMWALAESLLASQAFGAARGTEPGSLALLHATLRRGPLGLVEALCETPLPERANLLVLVDQFEEIFRYRRDIDSQEADAFVALLVASPRQRKVNVYIALTMRSDFLGDCAVFLDLPETINESQFLAPRMTRDQRAAAITEPARVFGGDVEPGLVNRMLNDMGADPDQLPLMQHALMRMWDLASGGHIDDQSTQGVGVNGIARVVLTSDHYRNVGGFSEALSSHADEALAELKEEREKRIAERIFRRLTKREEGERDTRDPTTLRELVAITEAPVDEVIKVINVFSQPGRSFLTPHLESSPLPSPDTIIDISHESLIRQWNALKNWVIDEAKSADTYLRLEETARLYRAENADPYRGLDLQSALEWRKTERPTDAWAKRYGAKGKETEAFEGAIAFLDESARNRDKEQASQERRWRITFFSVCAVMIGFMVAAIYMGWLWQTAEAEQNKAVALKLAAEGQLAENRQSNQLQLHALLAIESTKRYPSPLANESLRHALDLMPRPLAMMGHQEEVYAMAISPDGKMLATGGGGNTVRVWEVPTGEERQHWSPEHSVRALSFSPDSKLVASGGSYNTVRVWQVATGKELQRCPHEESGQTSIISLDFSPDGQTLASASEAETVRICEVTTGRELRHLSHEAAGTVVRFSPDGKMLASGSGFSGNVLLWEVATGKELRRWSHEGVVTSVTFDPDGQTLAVAGHPTVEVWNLVTGKKLRLLHDAIVYAVSFSPDGQRLTSWSHDEAVRVWDLAPKSELEMVSDREITKELKRWSLEAGVQFVSFSPDGNMLASVSEDNTVRFWEVPRKELRHLSHQGSVRAVVFSPDGNTLASGSDNISIANYSKTNFTVRLWKVATGKEFRRLPLESGATAIDFSPDGKSLASAIGTLVRLWEVATGKELRRWSHGDTVKAVGFSPDGKTLAIGSLDNTVRLWEVATGKEFRRLSHERGVTALNFSPDGESLASGSWDNTVRLWEVATGRELHRMLHEHIVHSVSFSPDGQTLASGSGDNTVRLWEVASGKELHRLPHKETVWAVSFSSPDGKTLASGSSDTTVRLWDLVTGKEFQRISHEDDVNAVSFSPDGKILTTGSDDGTVRLWLWRPDDLMAAVCERSTRNLSWNEWRLYFEDLPYAKTCPHLPVHKSVIDHAQQLAMAGNVAEALPPVST